MKIVTYWHACYLRSLSFAALVTMLALGMASCSDGSLYEEDMTIGLLNSEGDQLAISSSGSNDGGTSSSYGGGSSKGGNSATATKLVGHWVCYYQQWTEDGETDSKSYTNGDYYITFNSDFTGEMNSGSDELMEIGRYHAFTWSVSGNYIYATVYEGEKWQIVSVSGNELTLRWTDEGYSILCKFRKS